MWQGDARLNKQNEIVIWKSSNNSDEENVKINQVFTL